MRVNVTAGRRFSFRQEIQTGGAPRGGMPAVWHVRYRVNVR